MAPKQPSPLLPPRRIRRSSDQPEDIAHEEAMMFDLAYPTQIRLGAESPYTAHYRIGRKEGLEVFEEVIQHRQVFCWVCFRGTRVGAMIFEEWFIFPFMGNQEFVLALDTHSAEACEMAEVIASAWKVERLVAYGPIIDFKRLWMMPEHAKNGVWLKAASKLIARRYKHRSSIMLLKPFPLEYEGQTSANPALDLALAHRTAAMKRLYSKLLGARPMPESLHEMTSEWMWRPLSDDVPLPKHRRKRSGKRKTPPDEGGAS